MDAHSHSSTPPGLPSHVHVVPAKILLGVWGALLVLTWATVAATWIDLGPFNLWLALGIAVVKAGLVALYFMHLRYDHPFHGFLLIAALAFVMLLVALALLDSQQYRHDLIPGYAPGLKQP